MFRQERWITLMIYEFISPDYAKQLAFISLLLSFVSTCILLKTGSNLLPRDGGRQYAVNGALSKGKPRGAGIIFILVFSLLSLIFIEYRTEYVIYIILTIAAMLSGYLDDRSSTPWGEYLKGLIDLILSFLGAYTYWNFNGGQITIQAFQQVIEIPAVVFILLATILIWVSINVTNCSDGVDGLSGTLSAVTLTSIFVVCLLLDKEPYFNHMILLLVASILGYLWFNASPSKLMMGDAGSRSIGLFISIAILKTGSPLLYIPLALLLIIDGGLGLVKVSLLRFFKIRILTKVTTPIHDHLRKKTLWSDTQVVFRLTILQIVIAFVYIYCFVL